VSRMMATAASANPATELKRRFYLATFAFDLVLMTVFLLVPSINPLKSEGSVVLAGVMAVVVVGAVLLWRYPKTLPILERVFMPILALGVLSPLIQALATHAPPESRAATVTAFAAWGALAYVFAYLIFGTRLGIRVSAAFLAAGTALVVLVAAGTPSAVSAAAQYVVASVFYIALLHMFALVLERTVRLRERAEATAQYAFRDILTGLGNRLLLDDRLQEALARWRRQGGDVAVLMLDLDDFKGVNDTFGHHGGDALLVDLARRLRATTRASDSIFRLGGDEFAILANGVDGRQGAEDLARRILSVFEPPFDIGGRGVSRTGSIGVALASQGGGNAERLLIHADTALYRAKALGKGTYSVHDDDPAELPLDRVELAGPLAHALERGEMDVHYQPLLDLRSGEVVGVEALLRWHHPELGQVPPARFIPVAERTGIIHQLGRWVLERACRQGAAWQRPARTPLRIAVNVSAVQFAGGDFPAEVRRALGESGLSPELLELEITEGTVTQGNVADALVELRSLGVRIALDDFGTGYSSLGRLQDLPIDGFKIDRAFVSAVQSPRDATETALVLLHSMISLAQGLGLSVVAEGVETAAQMELLQATGCPSAQGFLIAHPMPADDVDAMLAERDPEG